METDVTHQNKNAAFSFNVHLGSSKSCNILYFTDSTSTKASRRNWTLSLQRKSNSQGEFVYIPTHLEYLHLTHITELGTQRH